MNTIRRVLDLKACLHFHDKVMKNHIGCANSFGWNLGDELIAIVLADRERSAPKRTFKHLHAEIRFALKLGRADRCRMLWHVRRACGASLRARTCNASGQVRAGACVVTDHIAAEMCQSKIMPSATTYGPQF